MDNCEHPVGRHHTSPVGQPHVKHNRPTAATSSGADDASKMVV
jgi:hypothetical protein